MSFSNVGEIDKRNRESVTDIDVLTGDGIDTRNNPRDAYSVAHEARHLGGFCGKCQRKLKARQTVWRITLNFGSYRGGGPRNALTPVCRHCGPKSWRKDRTHRGRCAQCDRPVVNHVGYTNPFEWETRYPNVFCSDVCSSRWHSSQRWKRKKEARRQQPFICEGCGKHFEPRRSDAKHCSSACKQRAYRVRMSNAQKKGGD